MTNKQSELMEIILVTVVLITLIIGFIALITI